MKLDQLENLRVISCYQRWKRTGKSIPFVDFVKNDGRACDIFSVFDDIFKGFDK